MPCEIQPGRLTVVKVQPGANSQGVVMNVVVRHERTQKLYNVQRSGNESFPVGADFVLNVLTDEWSEH